MTKIEVIGIDMAFANMGIVRGYLDVATLDLEVRELRLIQTEAGDDKKVVRKSSIEMRRARELKKALDDACSTASFAFAEVPSGSQSAAAARALGIALGVLATCKLPLIEVSPMEVKKAVLPGSKGVGIAKAEVIEWAAKRWPYAPWLTAKNAATTKKGKLPAGRLLVENEHCADACAAIVAGINSVEFQQIVKLQYAISSSTHQRPASSVRRVLLL